ncbi:MAG TPA: hypothetical protein VFA59_18940 [Vicinamibacterales bacterium]|nr:hypothetical protein [Vicinamibacterales bacterium]
MKSRILVAAFVLAGTFGASTFASRGDHVGPARRWAIVNFTSPVQLADQYLMGPYLFVHDDAKMAKGEACTSIYRFDPKTGPKEQVIAFHCTPIQREVCDKATFKVLDRAQDIPLLTEYQFAGDSEGHGVPGR